MAEGLFIVLSFVVVIIGMIGLFSKLRKKDSDGIFYYSLYLVCALATLILSVVTINFFI